MNSLKLMLLSGAAALAMSSAAMAQSNEVWINQQGTNQGANITQSGSGNLAGTGDLNRIQQNDGSTGSGSNTLTIDQSGTNGRIGQRTGGTLSNGTGAVQSGTRNSLDIRQGGSGNQITFGQSGTDNGNVPVGQSATNLYNTAGRTPGFDYSFGGAVGQWNFVNQGALGAPGTAIGNQIDLQQNGLQNGVIIGQVGSGGAISIQQGSGIRTGSNGNLATVIQYGVTNRANVDQRGAGASIIDYSLVDIRQGVNVQTSSVLSATVSQTAGIRNEVSIAQDGNNSSISFTQNGGNLNVGRLDQTGDYNLVTVSQTSTSGLQSFVSLQNGTGAGRGFENIISGTQAGGAGSSVFVSQNGNSNSTKFDQSGTGVQTLNVFGQAGNGNIVDAIQSAVSSAILGVTQTGNTNSLYLSQNGTASTATVSQTGDNNRVGSSSTRSTQSGTGLNTALLTQVSTAGGSGNAIDFSQNGIGALSLTVQQGTTVASNGNLVNSVQTGSGNTATIKQN